MNYFPTYLELTSFNLTHIHRCVCDDTEVVFRIYSRNKTRVKWDRLNSYLRAVMRIVTSWSKKQVSVIHVKVIEDYTSKGLPEQGRVLTPDHVNSGLTYMYGDYDGTNIVIFRMEEFAKVLCHELLHFYEIGLSTKENDLISKAYVNAFRLSNVGTKVNVNEALTELHAILIHTAVLRPNSFLSSIKSELRHTERLIHRLRDHFGITSNDWSTWTESTHAFSYIVIKYVLLATLLDCPMIWFDTSNRRTAKKNIRFSRIELVLHE